MQIAKRQAPLRVPPWSVAYSWSLVVFDSIS
jgi:hypothetical protein